MLKLIWEPKVYLVGQQFVDHKIINDYFLHDEAIETEWKPDSHPEGLCETAGRLCYMSFKNPRPGGIAAYMRNIIESGHGSVLEHAVYSFIFTGISRSLSHELVRHRAGWSYSQLSQRYVDSSDVAFVVPHDLMNEVRLSGEKVEETDTIRKAAQFAGWGWLSRVEESLHAYTALTDYLSDRIKDKAIQKHGAVYEPPPEPKEPIDATAIRKQARQCARSVLPNCTETKIFCTVNARALRHAIELRTSRHAEPEIRKLFHKVWHIVKEVSPHIFGDYDEVPTPDGLIELVTENTKV